MSVLPDDCQDLITYGTESNCDREPILNIQLFVSLRTQQLIS
jgi:hypothetical protein